MLRSMEGPSGGGGETAKSREISDEKKRMFARKIIEISMKYGLSEEDMDMLYGILDSTYGDGSSREAPHDTAETGTTEGETGTTEGETGTTEGETGTTESETGTTEGETGTTEGETGTTESETGTTEGETGTTEGETGATEGETGTTEGETGTTEGETGITEGETGTTESETGTTESETGTTEHESGEGARDYEPMTLAKAEATGNSMISIADVKEALKRNHPDIADIAVSLLEFWNSLTHENRLDVLRGNASENQKGMERILVQAGLIEITSEGESGTTEGETGTTESETGTTESETGETESGTTESETGETESGHEDDERRERAEAFINDEQKRFWLEKAKGINPQDLIDKPDEYTMEKLDELQDNYEKDCKDLAISLADDDEFVKWYGNPENLKEMGYKDLYELKQKFENRDDGPLIAAGLKSEAEMERRSRQIAERDVENENKHLKGLIRGVLIGGMWDRRAGKEWKVRRRQKEVLAMMKERNDLLIKRDAEGGTLSEADKRRLEELDGLVGDDTWTGCAGDTERFVMAHVNNAREMIRNDKGERMDAYKVEYGEDGTPRSLKFNSETGEWEAASGPEADRAIVIERVIRSYAKTIGDIYHGRVNDSDGNPITDPERMRELEAGALNEFRKGIAEMRQNDSENGIDSSMINNYEAIAIQAGNKAKHETGVDNVMRGFQYISGEMTRDVSSEAHRNAVERLANRLNRVPFVPEGAALIAAGVIMSGSQMMASKYGRAAAGVFGGVAALVAGSAIGGAFASFERADQLKGQYATASRELALGGQLEDGKLEGRMTKEIMKFMTRETDGARITAELLSGDIDSTMSAYNEALQKYQADPSEENKTILADVAGQLAKASQEAKMRLKMSDENNVDLVGFSTDNLSQVEKERTALWVNIAKAEAALEKANAAGIPTDLEGIRNRAKEGIDGLIKSTNKDIQKHVNGDSARRFLGRTAFNVAFGFFADEAISIISPNKIGIFENLGIIKTVNKDNATNSLLSGLMDKMGVPGFKAESIIQAKEFATQQKAEEYLHKNNQNTALWRRELDPTKSSTSTTFEDDAKFARDNFERIPSRNWMSNGTRAYDGNELRVYGKPGEWIAKMTGNSSDWNGQVLNAEGLQSSGKMEFLVSLSKDAQMNPVRIPVLPDGTGDYSGLAPEIVERIKSGNIYLVELAQTNNPGDKAINIFASYVYGKGGGQIPVTVKNPVYKYVVDEIATSVDRATGFTFFGLPYFGRSIGFRERARRTPGETGETESGETGRSGESGRSGGPESGGPSGGPESGGPSGGPESGGPSGGPESGTSEGETGTTEGETGTTEGETGTTEGETGTTEGETGTTEGETGTTEGETGTTEGETGESAPRLRPLTYEMLNGRGMRVVDVQRYMTDLLSQVRDSLNPDEYRTLEAAVTRWNNLKSNASWQSMLRDPRDRMGVANREMVRILEEHNFIERND